MIAALERLKQANRPEPLPDAMAAMGITGRRGFARHFSTHPPLEDRIDALGAGQRLADGRFVDTNLELEVTAGLVKLRGLFQDPAAVLVPILAASRF
jgi:hypothetical protein